MQRLSFLLVQYALHTRKGLGREGDGSVEKPLEARRFEGEGKVREEEEEECILNCFNIDFEKIDHVFLRKMLFESE